MTNQLSFVLFLFLAVAGPTKVLAKEAPKLKTLVITGGHGFEERPFFQMFEENPDITFTSAKHVNDADAYERDDLLSYDVVVLYDMPKTITESQMARFVSLFGKGTGLVVLHHALVSYQQWP